MRNDLKVELKKQKREGFLKLKIEPDYGGRRELKKKTCFINLNIESDYEENILDIYKRY